MSARHSTSNKTKTFKLRPILWRWHRRIGVAVALLVLLLSVTGIGLNHIDFLQWDQKPLRSQVLLSLYGVEAPQVQSYPVDDLWLSHIRGEHLYINQLEAASCHGDLTGALNYQNMIVAACGGELILLTPTGDVIERIGAVYQLPQPLEAIGLCVPDSLCLQSAGKIYRANLEQLRWPLLTGDTLTQAQFSPAKSASLPGSIREPLLAQFFSGGITWERVLLDLHSGRLFGLGPWLMDIAALLLIALSLSGLMLWGQVSRSKKSKARRRQK